jgi:hypothetical protein
MIVRRIPVPQSNLTRLYEPLARTDDFRRGGIGAFEKSAVAAASGHRAHRLRATASS